MRVLLVEDDSQLARALRLTLERDGVSVDDAGTIEAAWTQASARDFDAIVLDLGLPDGHGTTLIERLRRVDRDVPIAVLTGQADERATIRALDAGADDYLTKPVALDVFRARVRALVRRGKGRRKARLAAGNVVLDRLARTVAVDGALLSLTPRELALLEQFLSHTDSVVSREDLLDRVFGLRFDPGTNVLDVAISRLRRKLRDAGANVTIVGQRGRGFVLSRN